MVNLFNYKEASSILDKYLYKHNSHCATLIGKDLDIFFT